MSFVKLFRFLVLVILLVNNSYSIEPISTSAIASGLLLSIGYAGYGYIACRKWECCDDSWIRPNMDALEHALTTQLHGQHLVNFTVSRSLHGHLRNKTPKKALVMAFHGWTGSGKNYASKIIVENLFKKGAQSDFFHLYVSTYDFPHASQIQVYQDRLRHEIAQHTKLCGRSVFVFDEVDKMPPGVIDAIKPFLDFHEQLGGIDYRRNIFIFLSNTGGSEISKLAYNFWLKGEDRESITMKHIEPLINKGAFNEKGGLQHSEIIEKNLIDVYVPFLPLERKHVQLCIKDEFRSRSRFATPGIVNKIADQLQYWPPEFKTFSSSGCKKIAHKVDLYGDDSV